MKQKFNPSDKFFYTGKIADYLEYRGITNSPAFLNYEEDEPYADERGRLDNQGRKDR